MKTLAFTILAILLISHTAPGQSSKPSSLPQIASYMGSDREQILFEGAKKEGKIVWYTTLAGEYKHIIKEFEAKFPGVVVEPYRADARNIAARLIAEGQAGRNIADVVEASLPPLMLLRDNALLTPYNSVHARNYSELSKEPGVKGMYFWIGDREIYLGLGYNKDSLPPNVVPKRFQDFLRPELKGHLAFVANNTGARVMGAILESMGEEFINNLSKQDIRLLPISGTAMVDQLLSGEVWASPTVFGYNVSQAIAKGGPLGWFPMDLVPTNVGGAAVLSKAPRPFGALLLVDFLLSPEGQKIMQESGLGSPARDPGFRRWYPEKSRMTADQYEKEEAKWQRLLNRVGRK